jgi:6-phosphogluconolactonase
MKTRPVFLSVCFFSFTVLLSAMAGCGGGPSKPPVTVLPTPTPAVVAQFLYVASGDGPATGPHQLLGFPINLTTGALGTQFTMTTPNAVGGLLEDPTGKFLYASDFMTGGVAVFSLNPANGALTGIAGSPFPPQPSGASFFPGSLLFTDKTGRFVYESGAQAGFLGLSTSNTGALSAFGSSLLFSNARTVTFDPSNKFVYSGGCPAMTEQPLCLSTLGPTGSLTHVPLANILSLIDIQAHDVAVSPVGGFVFASGILFPTVPPVPNNSSEVLLSFSMDPATGILTPLPALITDLQPEFGATPVATDVVVDPHGKFLYVNTQDKIFGFSINAQGGLAPIPGSPFPGQYTVNTGLGFHMDATGNFLYEIMADQPPSTAPTGIVGLRIDQTTGALTPVPGSPFLLGIAPGPMTIAHIP